MIYMERIYIGLKRLGKEGKAKDENGKGDVL